MSTIDPRRELRILARRFFRRGWMEGTAGNLSIRQEGTLYITSSGRPKGSLRDEDILAISEGEEVSSLSYGNRRPSAETSIHRAIYDLFPETGAVLHIHTVESALITESPSTELVLPPLEVLKGLGIPDPSIGPIVPIFENDLHVPDIAKKIRVRLSALSSPLPVLLIRHHGTTAWGRTLEDAVRHLELSEFCFRFMVAKNLFLLRQP